MTKRYLSQAEVAAMLTADTGIEIPKSAVASWCQTGEIRRELVVREVLRIPYSEYERVRAMVKVGALRPRKLRGW